MTGEKGMTQNYALCIGAGQDLPVTVADAEALAKLLRDPKRCTYPKANVTVLTEQAANRAAVLKALDDLAADAPADGTVVVFFSGHGAQVESSTDEHYWLMPNGYDMKQLRKTAISGREFADKLAQIKAGRVLLLLDCCHAEGVGAAKAPPEFTVTKSPIPPEAAALFSQGSGRFILASCRDHELSYTGDPNSLFTHALLLALSGHGRKGGDGLVRVLDLVEGVAQWVPEWSGDTQHPRSNIAEKADNFVVAYYAAGAKEPLPLDVPIPSHEQFAANNPGAMTVSGGNNVINSEIKGDVVFGNKIKRQINTGGGAYIEGNLDMGAGSTFVGRDQHIVNHHPGVSVDGLLALLKQMQAELPKAVPDESQRQRIEAEIQGAAVEVRDAQPSATIISSKLEVAEALLKKLTSTGLAVGGLVTMVQQGLQWVGQLFR